LSYGRLFLQICRVEDIDVAGRIEGTVVHFHRARSVVVHHPGVISASGFGKLISACYIDCLKGSFEVVNLFMHSLPPLLQNLHWPIFLSVMKGKSCF